MRRLWRTIGLLETGEDAIPAVVDFLAGMPGDQVSKRVVMPSQHLVPGFVTHSLDQLGRFHDIGEHEGAGCRIAGDRLHRELAGINEHPGDATLVEHGAEPHQGRVRGIQFEDGSLRIAACLIGSAQSRSRYRLLVGRADLSPQCQRLAEVAHGTCGIPFGPRPRRERSVRGLAALGS